MLDDKNKFETVDLSDVSSLDDELLNEAENIHALSDTDEDFVELLVDTSGQDRFNTSNESHYDDDDIKVLEGLEAVRKRPGMYIGDVTPRGLHHLLYEIVANSVDEALAGRCDIINVTLNKDGSVTIEDDGSGIPVGIHPQKGIPTLEVVHTVLHAGGKFGGGAYSISGGLHGVGASVVNALSEWMEVLVKRDGNIYKIKFSRGDTIESLHIIGNTSKEDTGTITTFYPDNEIFPDIEFDFRLLYNFRKRKKEKI